jgi:pyrroloquinoline quinone biosynthesis protein D
MRRFFLNGARYRLARGVRLRLEGDGRALLLVPEAVVELNESAAATLELLDGARTVDDLIVALGGRFEAAESDLRDDVETLLADLAERGFVTG